MPDHDAVLQPNRPGLASGLRFLTELIAWVATPWALWPASIWLAIASVIVLIGLPTVFATPGDKAKVVVPVPGWATIVLVLIQLIAAVVASWFAWPAWAAVVTTALAIACLITERPRWLWLLQH